MPRIPQEIVERIKAAVPVAGELAKRGHELKKHGSKDVACRCPLGTHTDSKASFIVTPEKNLWHCLGCDAGGDVIELVMALEKVPFREAVERLLPEIELSAEQFRGPGERKYPPLLAEGETLDDASLLVRVAETYARNFWDHPQAMEYLRRRGVFAPEVAKRFGIGYANRTLGYMLPSVDSLRGKAVREQLQRIGIYSEKGHEQMSGCVVFPVMVGQRIGEIYGRRITNPSRGVDPHIYLKGPHAGVWNAESLKGQRTWLVCEAAIDALSFFVHGHENVTWTFGARGWMQDHWSLLRACRPERVVLCFDADEAGERGVNALAHEIEAEGVEVWRAEPPSGKDINDLVRGSDDPKNTLAALLAGAVRLLPPNVAVSAAVATSEPELLTIPTPEPKAPETLAVPTAEAFVIAGDQATWTHEGRTWRVRGLEANTSFEQLKVNVRLQIGSEADGQSRSHFDTFDLYQAPKRSGFAAAAAQMLGLDRASIEANLNALISHLEVHQDKRIAERMQPRGRAAQAPIDADAEKAALEVLRHPRMLDLVLADLHRCGLVGEDTNLLVAWLVSLSRKLEKPLGVCVMSRSAAGKSSLLESIARIVPAEDRNQYTALTPQALFHMPEEELMHKALFVAEDVGAEGAAYSLKTIQSDGQLVMACTMKDEATGQMMTKTKVVKGPVAVFLTSTSRSIDDELLNRLLVLTIDESPEQTRRIHEAQRHAQTLEGIIERRARPRLVALQQNVQRLIRPLMVRNPFVRELEFSALRLRSRRDHQKYIDLINVMALAHQYQRTVHSAVDADGVTFQYIEVERSDIERVDRLLAEVLEQTTDELTPASRRMLATLEAWAQELPLNGNGNAPARRWSRREIRERTGWSDTQVRLVLAQLVDFEHLVQIGQGGRGNLVRYQLADTVSQNGQKSASPVRTPAPSSQFAESSQSSDCELPNGAKPCVDAGSEGGAGKFAEFARGVNVAGAEAASS